MCSIKLCVSQINSSTRSWGTTGLLGPCLFSAALHKAIHIGCIFFRGFPSSRSRTDIRNSFLNRAANNLIATVSDQLLVENERSARSLILCIQLFFFPGMHGKLCAESPKIGHLTPVSSGHRMALLGPHFAMTPKHIKFAKANARSILQDPAFGWTRASHNLESDHRQLQSCVMNRCERIFNFFLCKSLVVHGSRQLPQQCREMQLQMKVRECK